MGICISHVSSEIHDSPEFQDDVIFLEKTLSSNDVQGFGFLYSKEGSKSPNQDAGFLYQGYGTKDGAICGVFDGHGKNGHVASKIVKNRLPSILLNQKNAIKKFKKSANDVDSLCHVNTTDSRDQVPSENFYKWREACISAFKVMDREIKLQGNLDLSCSGTTAVVALRQEEDLLIANLGDSRAVLGTFSDNRLKVVQLTTDLKPGLASEADRIRKCNGRVLALQHEPHIQRVWLPNEDAPGLAMSRAFGDFVLKNHGIIAVPEITYHRISPNDKFLVLASDGVWDVLSNDEVAEIICSAASENAAAELIVEAATASWKKKFPSAKVDDCTVVCLFLQKK